MTDIKLTCGASGCGYVTEEVSGEIAWGLLQYHRQNNHVQPGAGGGHQPRGAASGKLSKKPDRPSLDMDTTEGEWGIFEDCWARYKRMTGLVDTEGIRDEMRECCTKQLNTRLVQMHGSVVLGSCDEAQLMGFVKATAVRGVHKEVTGRPSRGCTSSRGRCTRPTLQG
jgi:hypothetical protein